MIRSLPVEDLRALSHGLPISLDPRSSRAVQRYPQAILSMNTPHEKFTSPFTPLQLFESDNETIKELSRMLLSNCSVRGAVPGDLASGGVIVNEDVWKPIKQRQNNTQSDDGVISPVIYRSSARRKNPECREILESAHAHCAASTSARRARSRRRCHVPSAISEL